MKTRLMKWIGKNPYMAKFYHFYSRAKILGVKRTCTKIIETLQATAQGKKVVSLNPYTLQALSPRQLLCQRQKKFVYMPKISVIVPVYKTPENFLRDMIDSVCQQTYANWELCLADGSNEPESPLRNILLEYARQDSRIVVKFLEQNFGISGNTNQACAMATGDYLLFLDHDDTLTPNAMFEVVSTINESQIKPDFIYSDMDRMDSQGCLFHSPYIKTDYGPDILRSSNYICHLSVISTELFEKIGQFDSQYDGSQDYDFILRACEQAEHIVHIPQILYHWRVHEQSVASSANAKPYAIVAAKNALQAHAKRLGYQAQVMDGLFDGVYRIKWKIREPHQVDVIVLCKHPREVKTIRKLLQEIYPVQIICACSQNEVKTTLQEIFSREIEQGKITVYDGIGKSDAEIKNLAVQMGSGDMLLFLDGCCEPGEELVNNLLEIGQLSTTGVVGGLILGQDNRIEYAGLLVNIGSKTCFSPYYGHPRESFGYAGRVKSTFNLSAVSGDVMLIKRNDFLRAGGFDAHCGVYHDADLCLTMREQGKYNVYTPYAVVVTQRPIQPTCRYIAAQSSPEHDYFKKKWAAKLTDVDPYYSKAFSIEEPYFSLK